MLPNMLVTAAAVLAVACSRAGDPQYGVWGFFCQSDSASMSMAGSEACWTLGSGNATSPYQRGWLQMVKWATIEPENGVYDFAAFDKNLSVAIEKVSGFQRSLVSEHTVYAFLRN